MLTLSRKNQDWLPTMLFDNFFDDNFMKHLNVASTKPAVNVIETAKDYKVEVAAPGMTKDDFKVRLDLDENLVITVEKQAKKEEKNEDNKDNKDDKYHYLRREFSYTQFTQTFIMPDDVDKQGINATVDNGVLTVSLPKIAEDPAKKEVKYIDIH